VEDGDLRVLRGGGGSAPNAVIIAAPTALAAVLWHGRSLRDAIRAGDVAVGGSRDAAQRFVRLFPLPD
jgi:hypothetical protein